MLFEKLSVKTPTAIGNLSVFMYANNEHDNTSQGVSYTVRVLDQAGNVMQAYSADLLPYLTDAEIGSLIAFMTSLRSRAADQILPTT